MYKYFRAGFQFELYSMMSEWLTVIVSCVATFHTQVAYVRVRQFFFTLNTRDPAQKNARPLTCVHTAF